LSKITFSGPSEQSHRYETSFASLVEAGSVAYKRQFHLQHLLPVTQAKVEDQSFLTCQWIIRRLARALRQERTRGRNAHWAYSLNRHIALLQAYRGEKILLEKLNLKSRRSLNSSA